MADLGSMSPASGDRRTSAILFDKDGTLLDYHLSWAPINQRAAHWAAAGDPGLASKLLLAGGVDPSTGHALSNTLLAAGTTDAIAAHWVAHGSPHLVGDLTRDLDRIFCEGVETVVPVLDLAAFFARLKARGLRLGIASSDSEAAIWATAKRFGFDGYLDFVGGYDSGYGAKPDPAVLTAFCKQVGVSAAEVAVVGDNLHDIEMGTRGGAGWRIAVLTGTSGRDVLEPAADLCLDSIAQLETALFKD